VRFVVDEVALKQDFFDFLPLFPPNHRSSIVPSSSINPLPECAITLTRQHSVCISVIKFEASSLTWHLAGYRARKLAFYPSIYMAILMKAHITSIGVSDLSAVNVTWDHPEYEAGFLTTQPKFFVSGKTNKNFRNRP
jgi:hypothetical protein